MEDIKRYILEKVDSLTVSVYSVENNSKDLYYYEEFSKIFIEYLTPNNLLRQTSLKGKFNNVGKDNKIEDFEEKILDYLEQKKQNTFIKDLKLEGNILYIKCLNLDGICIIYRIVISPELLKDELFNKILYLIIRTFENNKDVLLNKYSTLKKQKENQKLVNESIEAYLNNKKVFENITQKEAIIVDNVIHNNLKDSLDFFDSEYRPLHPFKICFIFTMPLLISLTTLGILLGLPSNIFSIFIYSTFFGGSIRISKKIWNKIIYKKFIEFKNSLKEKNHLSYDLDKKRTVLNNCHNFSDNYTKCIKDVLELAYSKVTTSLEKEIESLYSLLQEYQESANASLDKVYFTTSLLGIKKQIYLKESNLDNNISKEDEVNFAKRYINYLTRKNVQYLNDEKINSCLKRIKDCEEKSLFVYATDLQMGLVEYIYENYLKVEDIKSVEEPEKIEISDVIYDVTMPLEKKIKGD